MFIVIEDIAIGSKLLSVQLNHFLGFLSRDVTKITPYFFTKITPYITNWSTLHFQLHVIWLLYLSLYFWKKVKNCITSLLFPNIYKHSTVFTLSRQWIQRYTDIFKSEFSLLFSDYCSWFHSVWQNVMYCIFYLNTMTHSLNLIIKYLFQWKKIT